MDGSERHGRKNEMEGERETLPQAKGDGSATMQEHMRNGHKHKKTRTSASTKALEPGLRRTRMYGDLPPSSVGVSMDGSKLRTEGKQRQWRVGKGGAVVGMDE